MVTVIYSLGRVSGAGFWLAAYLVSMAAFLVVCLLFKKNRSGRGIIIVLLGLLLSEAICDGIWFLAYYPGGTYHNYGVGSVSGILLWPAQLFLSGIAVTKINTSLRERT